MTTAEKSNLSANDGNQKTKRVCCFRFSHSLCFFADRTGLEPATSAVTGQHSNQLNYRSLINFKLQLLALFTCN